MLDHNGSIWLNGERYYNWIRSRMLRIDNILFSDKEEYLFLFLVYNYRVKNIEYCIKPIKTFTYNKILVWKRETTTNLMKIGWVYKLKFLKSFLDLKLMKKIK